MVAHSCADTSGLAGSLPPLVVHGPVAFSIAVSDASDRMGHRLAPYCLTVILDGRLVFQARNDSLSFSQNRLMLLEWLELDGVREQWLHLRPGDHLPARRGEAWSLPPGGLEPGAHSVCVVAADWNGNQTSLTWTLDVRERPGGPAEVACGWQEDPVRVRLPAGPAGQQRWLTPFLLLTGPENGPWSAHDPAGITGAEGEEWRLVGRAGDEAGQTVLGAVPDRLTAAESEAAAGRQGLVYLGAAVRVMGFDRHNWDPMTVSLSGGDAAAAEDTTLAVFRQDRDRTWKLAALPEPAAGPGRTAAWRFPVTRPGRYALFRDVAPPGIGPPGNGAQIVVESDSTESAGVTLSRWAILPVAVDDRGSGIDPSSVRVWCDGQAQIAEPDPLRRRILVELPDDLAPGPHRLVIQAADHAGLQTRRALSLSCLTDASGE